MLNPKKNIEEVKKALKLCGSNSIGSDCQTCPYSKDGYEYCCSHLMQDALIYLSRIGGKNRDENDKEKKDVKTRNVSWLR